MVGLEQRSICGLAHSHLGVAGQQIHHHAFVGRIEMLDEDESHAVAGGGKGFDELSAGVEATRRGAYPDDQEVVWSPRRAAHRQRTPG